MARTASKQHMSHEETMEMINAAQNGDDFARDRLVEKNMRLIWSCVQKYRNRGYDQEDLFQVGSIGLLKAIDKFDTAYGVKFSTYAVPMIIGEIQRFIRDDGIVKVSRSIKELANKIRGGQLQDEPIEVIMEKLEVTDREWIKTALEYIKSSVRSMDEVIFENDGSPITIGDQLADDVNDNWFNNIALHAALRFLDDREKTIVNLRYFQDLTQSEVGQKLGISQVQVSRLEKTILLKIKDLYQSEEEKDIMAPKTAAGNREEAIRLLKETEMTNKEIHQASGVPLGSMGALAKKHRPQEITDRIMERTAAKLKKQKIEDSRRKVEKTEGTVVEAKDTNDNFFGAKDNKVDYIVIHDTAVPTDEDDTTDEPFKVENEVGSSVVEFNFNLNMSGVAVDKEEVLAKMEEATKLLRFVNSDKVSFKFNVGT
jgi:RNA polymerase sporulation-specific sigma factor